MTHCVKWVSLTPREREGRTLSPSQHLRLPTYDSPGGSTDQRFCSVRNYFRLVIVITMKRCQRYAVFNCSDFYLFALLQDHSNCYGEIFVKFRTYRFAWSDWSQKSKKKFAGGVKIRQFLPPFCANVLPRRWDSNIVLLLFARRQH